ncbi:MAG: hypothetical protein ACUVQY_08705 [Thermoproteota archaeon]
MVLQKLAELSEKYEGVYACFVEGELVSMSSDVRVAYAEAVKCRPGKKVLIAHPPKEKELEAFL